MAFEYGDDLHGFVQLESSYGSVTKPVAGDAFRARQIVVEPVGYERTDPGDRKGTYSVLERVEGRHSGKWSATVLLRPSGSLGVAPDFGDLLTLLMGTETVTGSTSVVYTQLKDRTAKHATIWRVLTDTHQFVRGAICNQCKISWGGTDYVVLEFSGPAKEYGWSSEDTLAAIVQNSTNITLTDADFFAAYATVQVDADDNSSAGYQIESINYTTEVAVLESPVTANTGVTIASFLPTPSYTGDPLWGSKGSVSLDGGSNAFDTLGGNLTITSGLDLDNRQFGTDTPHDVIMAGKWGITGDITFAVGKSEFDELSHAIRQVQKDLRVTFGDTSGKIMQIDADQIELDPSGLNVPDSSIVEVTVPITALGSSGEDNLSMTLI
jgi:hypothetical protein